MSLLWLVACAGSRPEFLDGPFVLRNPEAPLSAQLSLTTDVPTTLQVRLKGENVDLALTFPGRSDTHLVPLHGLRADRDIDVIIEVENAEGRKRTERTSFRTGAVPSDLPHLRVLVSHPERAFRGWILLPLVGVSTGRSWLVAIDPRDGEVAWFYDGPWTFEVIGLTEAGTLLGMPGPRIVELDLLGRDLRHWSSNNEDDPPEGAIPFDAGALNHDVRMQDGRVVVLSSRSVQVPAYPTSYEDPTTLGGPAEVEDLEVVSFDAGDGAILDRWPLSERLDTTRIGFDSLDLERLGYDWVHANALLTHRDGWLVSSRHQDGLISLDANGEVRWILSNPSGWNDAFRPLLLEGADPAGWPLHPHGPSIDREGNIVMLDNGNDGHTPYTPDPGTPVRSRVIAWTVDEDARTVETAWTWTPPDPLFSDGMGNAEALGSGDVVADFPVLFSEGDGQAARVFQFTPGDPEPVLDLRITGGPRSDPEGVKVYRAVAIPSFWPDDVVVERR